LRLIAEALAAGRDVVVDNTNPSPEEWQPLIETARQAGAGVVAYWFAPDLAGSLGRNAERRGRARVPEAGMRAIMGRLRRPGVADGFDAALAVLFNGAGGFRIASADGGAADAC
jgi:predicted kinase